MQHLTISTSTWFVCKQTATYTISVRIWGLVTYSLLSLEEEDCAQHALPCTVCMSILRDHVASCVYLQKALNTPSSLLHETETVTMKTASNNQLLQAGVNEVSGHYEW